MLEVSISCLTEKIHKNELRMDGNVSIYLTVKNCSKEKDIEIESCNDEPGVITEVQKYFRVSLKLSEIFNILCSRQVHLWL